MARTPDQVEFNGVQYTAETLSIDETRGWQEGAINPGVQSPERLRRLNEMLLDSLIAVAADQLPYSDCTDGRYRVRLLSGLAVPTREKLVGADTMVGFTMAESLGSRFYGNNKATLAERLDELCAFLADNGMKPSTHVSCGAAGGFVPVLQNIVRFAAAPNNHNFINRQKRFVPVYDAGLFNRMVQTMGVQIAAGTYEQYSDALVTARVRKYSGDDAIAQYKDDGRGEHGHLEAAIVRIMDPGVTVDTNKLAGMEVDGPQVFVNNDARLERLANLFGRGHDEDYATAFMAGEAFSDAGWGTLGRNLPTIVLRRSA